MCCPLQAIANGAGTCTATAIATAVASSTGNTCAAQVSLSDSLPPPSVDSFLALQRAVCAGLISRMHVCKACCNCVIFVNYKSCQQCPDLHYLRLVYASLTSCLVCRLVPLPPPPASDRALQQQWHSPLLRPQPLPRVASAQWFRSLPSLWRPALQWWVQCLQWQATDPLRCLLPACCGQLPVS